jgi:aryl-alcohol dehydrogenase-like predicted oxidoreductase
LLKQRVGHSDLIVSALGLGTVKFGRNQNVKYPHPFNIPTDRDIEIILNTATELGINLLDTAPAYGSSEERLGQLLKNNRKDWIISTKAGEELMNGESHFDFSAHAIQKSVERSLKRLKTDYIDIVLIHSDGDDEQIILRDDVFSILEVMKKKGFIRAYGMSTKTKEGGLLALKHADLAMITYHPAYTDEHAVIQFAHQHHKGIFIKKALASGHLNTFQSNQPIADSLRFIFNEPGVTSVIIGTINPQHLIENAAQMP